MALGKLGKYERVDVLGHGVSGIVYLAWDTLLKKQIALKEIDLQASDISRFLEEARVMDRLNHPNIVHVNGVDRIDGHVVIDMEYVKGANLQQVLRQEGRLPADRALNIAVQTLDALDYAHQMRTVHRDIKPANILVGRGDVVKLVDFGLAEILATNSYAGGAGTYAYMAPEDFAEEHHSDHRSDLWAVGVTLYEMLTGARPFNPSRPKDPFAWRRALLSESADPLSVHLGDPPTGLQTVLDRALAREKQDRYPTAGEFRDDLVAIREGRPLRFRSDKSDLSDTSDRRARQSLGGSAVTVLAPAPVGVAAAAHTAPVPAERPRPKLPRLGRRKEILPVRVEVDPRALNVGEIRKGDERTISLQVRILDGPGKPNARVVGAPPWAVVRPLLLDRRKQRLTVTADSETVWQTGDFQDSIRLQSDAGMLDIPVLMRVLPARRSFAQVASWFVPLFLSVILPALTVALLSRTMDTRYLIPSAALSSAMLCAMLLLVSVEADLGIQEKIACGVMLAVMTVILGIVVGAAGRSHLTQSPYAMVGTGVPTGMLLLVQAFTRRHWKAWGIAVALLSLMTCGAYVSALSG